MFANKLQGIPRLLLEVALRPIQGDRFQPTGFADLGAATYERPDGTRMLLLESAQSIANRLEQTCLDGSGPGLAEPLKGLPYLVVTFNGASDTKTSSLIEAHRLNSPFVISDVDFQKKFCDRAGYAKGKPLDWARIASAVFYFDPNSLLHGVFLANVEDGRVRFPRALTGFIEAEDIREAVSGGVKNNPFDPTGKLRAKQHDKDVYGNVPYARTEYVARRITAYFNLDLALLEGYKLPAEARRLLISLGLYKIRRFLTAGLRLRTSCDLVAPDGPRVTTPSGFDLPSEGALLKEIQAAIQECATNELFPPVPVTELETEVFWKKEEKKGKLGAAVEDEGEGSEETEKDE